MLDGQSKLGEFESLLTEINEFEMLQLIIELCRGETEEFLTFPKRYFRIIN